MPFKMFPWVPDGIYDYSIHLTRYCVEDGGPKTVVSKMWIDSGSHDTLPPDMRKPWGTYPDFPPKPEKKG